MITENIKEIAKTLVEEANVKVDFTFNNQTNRSMASYIHGKNAINFNINQMVKEFYTLEESGICFKDFALFVHVIVAHEIGHILDPLLEKTNEMKKRLVSDIDQIMCKKQLKERIEELKSVIIDAEKTAWNFAESILPKTVERTVLSEFISHCLSTYESGIDRMEHLVIAKNSL